MGDGLKEALKELTRRGRYVRIGNVTIKPRLVLKIEKCDAKEGFLIEKMQILMTDGQPDNLDQVVAMVNEYGKAGIPISCVGVSGCDENVLKSMASFNFILY